MSPAPSKLSRSILLAATLAAAVLLPAPDAHACSCAGGSGQYTAVPDYDVVFRGTVKALEVPQVLRPERMHLEPPRVGIVLAVWGHATVTVVMEVEESWRGVYTREIELDVGSGWCCDCSIGARFPGPGEELLVFASEHEGALVVSRCGSPIPIADAGPSLEAFGPGMNVLMPGRTGDERRGGEHRFRAVTQLVIVVFGLGLVLAAFLGFRRAGAEAPSPNTGS